ncbi:sucrose-6-phosphate hydrolase [Mangrovibacillus cuniculi]|uniref:Sucrose-6-phosphate hydrolase n=1 Tax=Mangrovibacillus cuniculi TaxID=2593652 RepID=A0A7S8CD26_9BACI|nr:sucrose-6-phosphate hydrolase [Mangrovibacillus cuniculi]QPC47776.1 sucrose-6-phosphate hydrolase [Mangrovibacillus cuniculi]
MSVNDQQLRDAAWKAVEEKKDVVESDSYRLKFHVMPPVGLLNDPNGWIHWKGTYHLFYQWMPFKTDHGAKFWGHFTSKDLVNWKHEDIALTPSEWFEKNGCYSGSAISKEDELWLYYTGNLKNEKNERSTYQCLAISKDGLRFDKKGPVVELPEEYTPHFRDPKVWSQDGKYFMVVGAQTKEEKGAVALLSSIDGMEWKHERIIAGGGKDSLGDFGYMFECPDLFRLDQKDVLVFSPQGLEAQEWKYQNVYQAGYVMGEFNATDASYTFGAFHELDRGFDFYAPQTTEDEFGRRVLVAWMSVPDQHEQEHPTIKHGWIHCMTIPREIKIVQDKIYQLPVKELEELRLGTPREQQIELEGSTLTFEAADAHELQLNDISLDGDWFAVEWSGAARFSYNKQTKMATLERVSYVDGLWEKRQCPVENVTDIQVFRDTSSIEVFVNGGEEVFTARIFPQGDDPFVTITTKGELGASFAMWELES